MNLQNKYIIGNWKANGDSQLLESWVKTWNEQPQLKKVAVSLCLPYSLLNPSSKLNGVSLGVQNISHFSGGAYTGEITASMVKEIISFCIVGHSERRKHFNETLEQINKKIENLLKCAITPVYCFEKLEDLGIVRGISNKAILVYEPSENISNGGNFKEIKYDEVFSKIVEIKSVVGDTSSVLYGGSVTEQSALELGKNPILNGFLVGQASLDPLKFYSIAKILES